MCMWEGGGGRRERGGRGREREGERREGGGRRMKGYILHCSICYQNGYSKFTSLNIYIYICWDKHPTILPVELTDKIYICTHSFELSLLTVV